MNDGLVKCDFCMGGVCQGNEGVGGVGLVGLWVEGLCCGVEWVGVCCGGVGGCLS